MSDYSDCIIYSENQEFMPGNTVKWISNIDNRPGFEGNYSMHWHMPFDETQVPIYLQLMLQKQQKMLELTM